MSMIKYIFKRMLAMIPVLFGGLLLSFFLSRAMPGDPVGVYLPPRATPEQYWDAYYSHGFHLPLWQQFFIYLGDIFSGDWGYSITVARHVPVWDLIWQRFPRTLDITMFSMIIASFLGIKTGVISARHRNKWRDTVFRGTALIGVSIPVFWLGLILQYFIGYQLGWLPVYHFKDAGFVDPPQVTGFRIIDSLISGQWYLIGDYLVHLAMPVFCLAFIMLASITRQTRSSMLEVLQQDYIRTARAKGCREKDVIKKHARKNALIPTVTIIGLNVGGLLGGAFLTETTFNLFGVGNLLLEAITGRDYSVLNAIVVTTTLIFIVVNLFVDLIYAYLDPRIKY
ncbi:MAG: ABC transporter permease [Candidatus Hermodarchaeota archaeon]